MEVLVAPQEEKTAPQLDPRRWLMLAVVLCATLMGGLDLFIVNVAMPSIQQELHASFAEVQLVVAGYALAYAVLLVTGGRMGDLYGRKRLFLLGVAGFTLFSALCGFAPNAILLIVFRVFQGATAALMAPQVIAFIQVSFDPSERPLAFSGYTTTMGLSSILGQVLGGLLLGANILGTGWRSIFLVNVPIGVVTLVAATFLIRESRHEQAQRLDFGGVVLLSVSLFLLVFPLVEGSSLGWPLWSLICLALFVPAIASFIVYEQRVARRGRLPLVSLSLFQKRSFSAGISTILLNGLLFAPFMLILAFYLQSGLHLTPLEAGLAVAVASVAFMITSSGNTFFSRLLGNWSLPGAVILASLGYALTLLMAQFFVPQWGVPPLLFALFVLGFGQGLLISPLMNKTLAEVPGSDVGAASGVFTTTMQTSGALGVAVIGTIFASLTANGGSYLHAFVISLLLIVVVSLGELLTIRPLWARRRPQVDVLAEASEVVETVELVEAGESA